MHTNLISRVLDRSERIHTTYSVHMRLTIPSHLLLQSREKEKSHPNDFVPVIQWRGSGSYRIIFNGIHAIFTFCRAQALVNKHRYHGVCGLDVAQMHGFNVPVTFSIVFEHCLGSLFSVSIYTCLLRILRTYGDKRAQRAAYVYIHTEYNDTSWPDKDSLNILVLLNIAEGVKPMIWLNRVAIYVTGLVSSAPYKVDQSWFHSTQNNLYFVWYSHALFGNRLGHICFSLVPNIVTYFPLSGNVFSATLEPPQRRIVASPPPTRPNARPNNPFCRGEREGPSTYSVGGHHRMANFHRIANCKD